MHSGTAGECGVAQPSQRPGSADGARPLTVGMSAAVRRCRGCGAWAQGGVEEADHVGFPGPGRGGRALSVAGVRHRVRCHVLICMLACYLTWHLRHARAPLTFTDEHPPAPANPVIPAQRSPSAQAKASRQHDQAGRPCKASMA